MVKTNRDFFNESISRLKAKEKIVQEISVEENVAPILKYLKARHKEDESIDIKIFDKHFKNVVGYIMDDLKIIREIIDQMDTPDKLRKKLSGLNKKLKEVQESFDKNPAIASFFDRLERAGSSQQDDGHLDSENIFPATQEEIDSFFDSPIEESHTIRSKMLTNSLIISNAIEKLLDLPDDSWIWFQRIGEYSSDQRLLFLTTYKANNKVLAVSSTRLLPFAESIGLTSQKGQGTFISLCCKAMDEAIGKYFRTLGTFDVSPETVRVHIKNRNAPIK